MNEEEKQAFKILNFYNSEDYGTEELKKYIKIIVNLVDKQQKEIEKYKNRYKEESELNIQALNTLKECVHKDKIKEKIKETEFYINNIDNAEGQAVYKVLKELLGE